MGYCFLRQYMRRLQQNFKAQDTDHISNRDWEILSTVFWYPIVNRQDWIRLFGGPNRYISGPLTDEVMGSARPKSEAQRHGRKLGRRSGAKLYIFPFPITQSLKTRGGRALGPIRSLRLWQKSIVSMSARREVKGVQLRPLENCENCEVMKK